MSTVIPDPLPQPSLRLPHPSLRRKPESMAYGHIHRHSASPSRHSASPHRHSGASRNLWRTVIFTVIPDPLPQPSFRLPHPSFRRKPESMAYGHVHRHSGSPPPSFRRKPESMLARSPNRHSGASRNLRLPPPPAVIPAQAGIYPCRLPQPSFRLPQPSSRRKPESTLAASPRRHSGASRNDGCRGIVMLKTHAALR